MKVLHIILTMSEKTILNKMQLFASSLGHRLFRNNNGLAYATSNPRDAIELKDGSILLKNPIRIKYGLGVGTGDLIGGTRVKITDDMVGKSVFLFTNYEIKTKNTKVSKEQKAFHEMVERLGGISIIERFSSDSIEGNSYVEAINRFQAVE